MALDKFYNIYGLDTSAFYFDDEMELSRRLDKAKRIKNKCKKRQGIRLAASGDDNHVELFSQAEAHIETHQPHNT